MQNYLNVVNLKYGCQILLVQKYSLFCEKEKKNKLQDMYDSFQLNESFDECVYILWKCLLYFVCKI